MSQPKRNIVTDHTARTFRIDRGKPITVDVRSRSKTAVITDASGRKRRARFMPRERARYGYVIEKGRGLRVEQPRSISRMPRLTRSAPTPKR